MQIDIDAAVVFSSIVFVLREGFQEEMEIVNTLDPSHFLKHDNTQSLYQISCLTIICLLLSPTYELWP